MLSVLCMHDAAITVRSSGSRRMTCDSRWRIFLFFLFFMCAVGIFGMEIGKRERMLCDMASCVHMRTLE